MFFFYISIISCILALILLIIALLIQLLSKVKKLEKGVNVKAINNFTVASAPLPRQDIFGGSVIDENIRVCVRCGIRLPEKECLYGVNPVLKN